MTDEITQAFDHPEARSAATAPEPRDRLSLRDHIREVEIGAFETERGRRQRLRFNVVVEVAPPDAPIGDDVDRILSYDNLTDAISAELGAERLNLLETLAERIAARILLKPRALRVFVRIEKLDRGPGALGVEIVRARQPEAPAPLEVPSEPPRPAPQLVLLSAAAAEDARLSSWLDAVAGKGAAVLVVAPAALPLPETRDPEAARQVALLALDQAAWALAGRDPRLIAVAARTELDWAIGEGRLAVWAPAKMVRDAAQRVEDVSAPALAVWLAGRLGVGELVLIGAPPPPGWSGASTRLDVSARAGD
ncbi:dihydroneopterin aldolase [Meinhardsimonia xiamenensis]|jgi:dihydroneopterin aldolase|uniref:Dihydroneopterin aldolase n=1 Tax=Meinhardsimonia xiamenensis TaxID=990712 RepID=A0A1G9D0Q8_9RHOB|nr:dihydroneopterin aldolase [Meinhardsimonia xiamenensis]PRX38172.1 dihydroneopterin aldolase [Meinhardsimonia xiamenensis]SDK57496.1 dihydroneopterin aldolase [Meinhardsimonia xiamenensis]